MSMRLIGMHLVGVDLVGVYLIGMHLMGVDLIGMHLMGVDRRLRDEPKGLGCVPRCRT
jgi:hypothetical protein